jgi:hypothetical protein
MPAVFLWPFFAPQVLICGVFYIKNVKEEIAMIMIGITLLTWLVTEKDST